MGVTFSAPTVPVAQAHAGRAVPGNGPERMAALLSALAHGAADRAAAGHLARDGKRRAEPADQLDDLLLYLEFSVHRS